MKIAVFSDLLIPPLGGIEQHILAIANELSSCGHEVRVYAPGPLWRPKSQIPNPKIQTNSNFEIPNTYRLEIGAWKLELTAGLPLPFIWPNFRFALTWNLSRKLREWAPDVIHFHTAGPLGWFASSLRGQSLKQGLSSFKIVGTFHSYFMNPEYLGGPIQNSKVKIQNDNLKFKIDRLLVEKLSKILWSYARWLYNRADAIVTPTQFVADDLARRGFKSIKAVVPTVVSLEVFKERVPFGFAGQMRQRWGLKGPTLLYVGRISREKSLDLLLRALKLLNSQLASDLSPLASLLLVGDGLAVGELERLSEALGIRQQVVFLGRINHDDLPQSGVYEVSSLFVLPSTSETMSIVALEAMAKGLPVVVPAGTAAAELLQDNGSTSLTTGGLTFTAGDDRDLSEKIFQVISNKEKRDGMGEASKNRAKDFSLAKTVEKLEKVYKGL